MERLYEKLGRLYQLYHGIEGKRKGLKEALKALDEQINRQEGHNKEDNIET